MSDDDVRAIFNTAFVKCGHAGIIVDRAFADICRAAIRLAYEKGREDAADENYYLGLEAHRE